MPSKEQCDALHKIKLQQLRGEIHVGLADRARGAYTEHEADALLKLAERIMRAGRDRLSKK